jgi:dTDP-glucose 4,6-dehydratase
MSILVTGGAGFVGANFARHWRRRRPGDMIVVLDALTYAGNRANLDVFAADPNFEFVHGDICDVDLVQTLFRRWRFERVVHLAAESHVDRSIDDPQAFVRTNVIGTQTLLQAALNAWAGAFEGRRFLQVSTDEVYGSLGPDDPPASEQSRFNPTSPYAASKAAGDMVVGAYVRTYGLPALITRCSNNYGPFQFPEKLIPLTILNALHGKALPVYGDGMNIREWLYVEDHCVALDEVLERGRTGETYNIGSGTSSSNIDLVGQLCDLIDRRVGGDAALTERFSECPVARHARSRELISFVKDRPGHDRRYAIGGEKLGAELGVTPRTALAEGLAGTVEWYLAGDSWWRPLLGGAWRDWMQRHYGTVA